MLKHYFNEDMSPMQISKIYKVSNIFVSSVIS